MALADVLQWADATRARALVQVTRAEGMSAWLAVEERVVGAAPSLRPEGRLGRAGARGAPGAGLQAATREALLDLFLWREGRFELRNDARVPSGAVALEIPIPFHVMEGLRLLDE